MVHYLDYPYTMELVDGDGNRFHTHSQTYTIDIQEGFQDIFEYMFEKRYGSAYDPLNWYLERGAGDMYDELMDRWVHNQVDTFGLYGHDQGFLDFLMGKYSGVARDGAEAVAMEYIRATCPPGSAIHYGVSGDWFETEGEVYP